MELSSFLFGNVDEEGRLENEELDEELRRYLTQFSSQKETSEMFKQITETDLAEGAVTAPADHTLARKPSTMVQPLAEAIDYSDIKEEAEESPVAPHSPAKREFSGEEFEEFDELFQEFQERSASAPKSQPPVTKLLPELEEFLHKFDRTKSVRFTSLFFPTYTASAETAVPALQGKKGAKVRRREENANFDLDTKDLMLLSQKELESKVKFPPKISFKGPPTMVSQPQPIKPLLPVKRAGQHLSTTQLSWVRYMDHQRHARKKPTHAYLSTADGFPQLPENYFNFELIPWERKTASLAHGREEKPLAPYLLQRPYLLPHNWDLEKGAWNDTIVYEEGELPKSVPTLNLLLNMNDPYLLFDRIGQEDVAKRLSKAEKLISGRLRKIRKAQRTGLPVSSFNRDGISSGSASLIFTNPSSYFSKPFADRVNISNDRFYESTKDKRAAALNAFEKVTLHHSIPALRLSPPHFKCGLSKTDLRLFHRPRLEFAPNYSLSFNPLKKNRKAKKHKEFGEVIKSSKGITLRDDTEFALFEFAEEQPLLMSASGMGSLLNIYYRKQAPKDTRLPESVNLGIPTILEPQEPGPFAGFADIAPGRELTVLYNNLYRAPTFGQSPPLTDFLVVKYNREGQTAFYLREIGNIFTVGQALPCIEVFGPHSRKLNVYSRNRVQVAAYRYFQKRDNVRRRVKISSLTSLFPQFSEGTIRKWLKDYAESSRQGKDSGYWIMKQNAPNLAEEELLQLVTPEMVCQYESMLVGQQRLVDSGHSSTTSTLPIESEVAESMDDDQEGLDDELKLTPWNLTNNFLLACQGKAMLELHGVGDPIGMNEGFSFIKVPLKTQIAYRQAYDSPKKPFPSKGPFYNKATQADQQMAYRKEIVKVWEQQLSSMASRNLSAVERDAKGTENANESLFRMANDQKFIPKPFRGKKLTITRKVRGPAGLVTTETVVVSDSRIINAYVQHAASRNKIPPIRLEPLQPAHKKKQPPASSAASVPVAPPSSEKAVTCGACGQVGHMRTNKACPMFTEEAAKLKAPAGGTKEKSDLTLRIPKISLGKKRKPSILAVGTDGDDDGIVRRKRPLAQLNGIFEKILAVLHTVPESWPFYKPVSEKYAPNYHAIIERPMDFSTIKSKCINLEYEGRDQFMGDLELISSNCERYNGSDHPFSKVAQLFLARSRQLMDEKYAAEIRKSESEHRKKENEHVAETVAGRPAAERDIDIVL